MGPLARNFNQLNSSDDDGDDDTPLAGIAIEEYIDKLCLHAGESAQPKIHDIILDSGSEINCVYQQFLIDVREGVRGFKGLSRDKTKLTKVGTLEGVLLLPVK